MEGHAVYTVLMRKLKQHECICNTPHELLAGTDFFVLCCVVLWLDTGSFTYIPYVSETALCNMGKWFTSIHKELLYNQTNSTDIKAMCMFYGIYCIVLWARKDMLMA